MENYTELSRPFIRQLTQLSLHLNLALLSYSEGILLSGAKKNCNLKGIHGGKFLVLTRDNKWTLLGQVSVYHWQLLYLFLSSSRFFLP